ncbi:Hypothetical protein I595_2161 [Croceitalea dokdonensis DOKDO 023]|uniref:Uncharacterized protein n=1 Tax=Croceitalea dokdonensis DOKDO 023 TaxID=1300341 RepID=A0A0P7B141_9FLAO|nr:Hypothetical protein I595_2161 [Croceitalea dokdonensis DOKDO 023]
MTVLFASGKSTTTVWLNPLKHDVVCFFMMVVGYQVPNF